MSKRRFNREQKHNIERILAATFITQKIGYSFPLNQIILQKKNIQISSNSYTNTMTSVIRNVFRKIEIFLKEECHRTVTPLTAEEMTLMRSPLVQAREWLYKEELQTFFKFVRLTYNLIGDIDISADAAKRLHGQILYALEKQAKYTIQKLKKRQGCRHTSGGVESFRVREKMD